MNWLKNVIYWIKSLFKRFKFDNELFAKGVNEVAKQLKVLLKKYPIAKVEVLDKLEKFLFDKFSKSYLKPIKAL